MIFLEILLGATVVVSSHCLQPEHAVRVIQKQLPEVFYKKSVFLKISGNSQENNCAGVSLIKLQVEGLQL